MPPVDWPHPEDETARLRHIEHKIDLLQQEMSGLIMALGAVAADVRLLVAAIPPAPPPVTGIDVQPGIPTPRP